MNTKFMPTAEQVLGIIKERLSHATGEDCSKFDTNTVLFDQGLDSLDLVETEMYIEDSLLSDFRIRVDFTGVIVYDENTTLGSFRDCVMKEIEKVQSSS